MLYRYLGISVSPMNRILKWPLKMKRYEESTISRWDFPRFFHGSFPQPPDIAGHRQADFVFRDTAELSLEDFVETVLQFRGQSPATVKVPGTWECHEDSMGRWWTSGRSHGGLMPITYIPWMMVNDGYKKWMMIIHENIPYASSTEYLPTFARKKSPSWIGIDILPYMEHMSYTCW